jgi:ABC-type multidrug transport system fused ATPase/permease subunit
MFKLGLESMEAFREIVVFDRLDYFKPIFKKTVDRFGRTVSDYYIINSISPKFVETVAVLAIFSIFVSGFLLNKDLSTLADFLIIFAIAAFRVIPSMNKMILFTNYIKGSMFIFEQFDLAEGKKTTERSSVRKTETLNFKQKLEIRDLSFSFDDQHKTVLEGLNLSIRKGETIGVIGPSGSGKTTLLNILLRLYEEKSGGIYIDDEKISRENLQAWYKLVSYVPQNITLLDGTITENIAFGQPAIDREKLAKVIQQSQLEEFVKALPNGTETEIGEKGVKISGGQRQRIGIARALYHGGSILIFDEATSALDTETEEMLTESINNLSHDELTIIIVAHRIQTLKYCDRIYKLENGKISVN